jgi:hypothetical protein
MTVRISAAVRTAMVDAVKATIDAGAGAGKIRIYTGAQPATPATAASGTLLVDIPFNDPSFEATASGVASADVTPTVVGTAVATGTAGWFRVLDSNNNACIDGTVTATGGGGDITIASTSITTGLTVTVTGLTLTQPAS